MLIVISPAKTLDVDTPTTTQVFSQPDYLDQSALLIAELKQYSVAQIATLMKVSDKLAALNMTRYLSWHLPFSLDNAKQAILTFKGDVYTGLEADTLDEKALAFCQQHVRILSGLYGVLKPLDLIQPYRLEMGTKLKNSRGNNLYQFWGVRLTMAMQSALALPDKILLNLASYEYFKALQANKLSARIITPVFKDWRNGQYKIISFYAKKARGLMSRYVIDNQLDAPHGLKDFKQDGYAFNKALSNDNEWVFTRRQGL